MEETASSKRIKASALPDEIVEEILAHLPAKSLRRFQCVSRPWRDLITSPSFRDLHYSKRAGRGRRLFVRPAGYCQPFYACRHPTTGRTPTTAAVEEELLSCSQFPQGNVFPVTKSSCRGLVLLRCVEYDAHYVWNPSTGETLTLPDRTPFRTAGRRPRTFVSYGLGYCPVTNEHRAVRMYCLDGVGTTVCEVFTLDKSTHWRPAATEPPACRLRVRGSQGAVLCDGDLHFVGEDGVITTFNVTDETFGTLMPPSGLEFSGFDLTELDGCLCAYFSGQTQIDQTPCDPYRIWLLRDRAAQGRRCWEELRCIDWGAMADVERAAIKSHWIAPLALYPGDGKTKKVMFGTGSCKVFVVDPSDGIPAITFSLDGEPRDGQFPTMGLFEESLTSVGRASDEIMLSSPSAEAWCNVLSRLPARVVGRLNQVCKDWRAMIKNECFVDAHLLQQANQSRSPQIMFTDGKPNSFKFLENLVGSTSTPPLVDERSRVVCSKPCHGLNAGSSMCYDFVCNPLTGYYKALPLGGNRELGGSSVCSDIARSQSSWHRSGGGGGDDTMSTGRFGLGYDMEMGTHVLVRIAFKERNLATRDYELECQIRNVEDRFWEELDPPQRPIADTPPAYANGKLYWMADGKLGHHHRSSSSSGHEIVALDVSAREFEILEGPPRMDEDSDECVSVVELQGQVCMACSHPSKGTLEIWAMEDDGCWSMAYCIEVGRFSPEYSSEHVTLIAIDSNDGRILLSTGKALGYYDPKTATMQTVYSLGKHVKNKKFVPILFQESLINPRGQVQNGM